MPKSDEDRLIEFASQWENIRIVFTCGQRDPQMRFIFVFREIHYCLLTCPANAPPTSADIFCPTIWIRALRCPCESNRFIADINVGRFRYFRRIQHFGYRTSERLVRGTVDEIHSSNRRIAALCGRRPPDENGLSRRVSSGHSPNRSFTVPCAASTGRIAGSAMLWTAKTRCNQAEPLQPISAALSRKPPFRWRRTGRRRRDRIFRAGQ
ncbi:MAG: hypothetical protein ACI8UO_005584 [Verrucomicrobiales bacterium]|jgi:hypothetical protein